MGIISEVLLPAQRGVRALGVVVVRWWIKYTGKKKSGAKILLAVAWYSSSTSSNSSVAHSSPSLCTHTNRNYRLEARKWGKMIARSKQMFASGAWKWGNKRSLDKTFNFHFPFIPSPAPNLHTPTIKPSPPIQSQFRKSPLPPFSSLPARIVLCYTIAGPTNRGKFFNFLVQYPEWEWNLGSYF